MLSIDSNTLTVLAELRSVAQVADSQEYRDMLCLKQQETECRHPGNDSGNDAWVFTWSMFIASHRPAAVCVARAAHGQGPK